MPSAAMPMIVCRYDAATSATPPPIPLMLFSSSIYFSLPAR